MPTRDSPESLGSTTVTKVPVKATTAPIKATITAVLLYQGRVSSLIVGQTIALTILYEVGELTRFANVKVFSSYCRVVPGVAQSGNVTRRGRGSKQGNHYLKAAFSQAAVHAVRCYPKVRRYYERQLKRHQGRGRQMICYNIIAHKLAQAAFHVLKEQTEYREELLFGR